MSCRQAWPTPRFVGSADRTLTAQLKPYVYIGKPSDGGNERPAPGMSGAPKMEPGGMKGTFYSRLVDQMLLTKPNRA